MVQHCFKKITLFLLILLGLLEYVTAQTANKLSKFPEDSIKFFETMDDMLREVRSKEGKELMEEFKTIWYGGVYSTAEREKIYKTCNYFLKKRLDPFPHFSSYLQTIINFKKSDLGQDNYDAWLMNLEKVIEGKSIHKLEEYLNFSGSFFSEKAIYKSNTTKWVVDAKSFIFDYSDKPFLVFPSTNLKCYAKGDSSIIYNTSGIYYPTIDLWEGKNGTIDWVRAGFDKKKVYAELSKYKIDTKSSDYQADTVTFYNHIWFKAPIIGRVNEKVLANADTSNASYPEFVSYEKRYEIPNIIKNVDYQGGFTLKGNKFIGSGDDQKDALLIIYRENKPKVKAYSKSFTIRASRINSNEAHVVIYLEEDSISHPKLDMTILSKERVLSLVRSEEGLSKTPFFNSYHQVEMYFEQVKWKLDEPTMSFGPLEGTITSEALLDSKDFFRQDQFDRLTGIDANNPLSVVLNCSRKNDNAQKLSLKEVSKCFGISESQTKSYLIKLSTLGFLEYHLASDEITLRDKLQHFVFSNAQKSDYDMIQFKSVKSGGVNNALLNLLNNEVRMEGVEFILLSDSQRVFVYPEGQKITLKKNRDFTFTGVINAGGFEYFGKEFEFEYDKFKIKMPQIDSSRIYVNVGQKDDRGREIESMVRSTIENLTGELLIDNPGNKSGIKSIAKYPVFRCTGNSYVYYDKKSIFGGVYNRDRFYFQLKPFEFDSLDNFPLRSLNFEGTLTSSDIFPEFQESISLMNDLSLGFIRKTPEGGFPAYKGKGIYKNDIILSNRGLRGDGTLSYLTSTIESNDFIFFPDSMNTVAKNFEIEERTSGIEVPPVFGQEVKIHWRPYQDFMNASHTDKPIAMYDGSKFTGTLTNGPKGLTGNGMLAFQKAEVESKLHRFKFSEFDADTAEFRLRSDNEGPDNALSFATNNVKAHIDFKAKKGDFVANGGGSFVEFPQNKYIAFMDKFTWYMEEEGIELSATTKIKDEVSGVQLEGSEFISVHPNQDSLRFYSNAARYDVKNHIITAKQVKFINVADAMLYPDSEKVVIHKEAQIQPLTNAQIIANSTNKYHKIYNATINIGGRYKYHGSGSYDYLDENKKSQGIYFADIHVDSSRQTVAKGTVQAADNFTLSPNYEYKGDVILEASKKDLTFDGNGRLNYNCESIPKSWFRFKGEIDPNDIYIPIDSILRNDEKNPIAASIMIKNDSAHIYPRFVSPAKKYSDIEMVHAHGFLYFDKTIQQYKISNMAKLNEIALPGNYVSLNTANCNMYAEGKMNFGVDFGAVKINPVGQANYYTSSDSTSIVAMLLIDYFFNENAMDIMAKKIKKNEGLEGVNSDRTVFERGLQEYVGKETADKLISQLNLYGEFKKFPDSLNKTLFINDVKFRWDGKNRSYKSVGKIGIGNIYKEELNKYVDGQIEIVKKRSGDILFVNLQMDESSWYFFNYTRDIMYTLSSDDDFNKSVKDTKGDKKKLKYGKGKTYTFQMASAKKRNDFLRKFNAESAAVETEDEVDSKKKNKDKGNE